MGAFTTGGGGGVGVFSCSHTRSVNDDITRGMIVCFFSCEYVCLQAHTCPQRHTWYLHMYILHTHTHTHTHTHKHHITPGHSLSAVAASLFSSSAVSVTTFTATSVALSPSVVPARSTDNMVPYSIYSPPMIAAASIVA